jgi:hypothetical protein
LKNVYTSAQAYFSDNPAGTVTATNLASYGYKNTTQVVLTITNGSMGSLSLTTSHPNGDKTYSIDAKGVITE